MPKLSIPITLLALTALCAAAQSPRGAAEPARPADVDFDRDVLPILATHCLDCHSGPAAKARLDLLSRENALAGGRSDEPAVVPGDAQASRLLAVVTGEDDEYRMPPRGELLSPAEVATLRAWIESGAEWSAAASALRGQPWHWAYRAPVAPSLPEVADPAWRENPIDRFVLAAILREGLAHAPPAPRETLARRLSLTLTGLPPAPEEVERFAGDREAGALERYVDGLLDSPHYGERMARLWLDLARYADTHGYEKDDRRSMWPWRDGVIRAFNGNQPFDRFALEQLAGDLLPDADLDTRVATGFHRNTMINEEGGTDPEEFRVEAVHDRANTTASAFLGTTMGCAQCHDHKFDPVTIEDYYGFYAFFDDDLPDATAISPTEQRASGATLAVPPPDRRTEFEAALGERDAATAIIGRATPELEAAQAAWERARREGPSPWKVLAPAKSTAESGARLDVQADGSIVASGTESALDTYRFEVELDHAGVRALRLELLPEPSAKSGGAGRGDNGNVVVSELGAQWTSPDGKRGGPIVFARATASHEQRGNGEAWLAPHAVDGITKTGWAIGPRTREAHELVLEASAPFGEGPGSKLRLTLVQRYGGAHTIARLRLSCSTLEDGALLAPLPVEAAAVLALAPDQRTPQQAELLAAHHRAFAPLLAAERARLDAAQRTLASISTASTLVMQRAPKPRATFVHRKGNFLDPGLEVEPALPAVFGKLASDAPRDRLGLARWIASRDNPLFARVFVNHVWQMHFGRGLVATSDDFGTQGDRPTHPELLDWLARDFADHGFDVKRLHRGIVTSQTFLQDSRWDAAAHERDPENVWLARGPRFRLEAEALRDVALAASGLLVRRIGGPSVFPPQPPGIWTMIYSSDQWVDSTGEDRYRRGLYTFWRRTAPYPSFAVFDAPSREVSCTRRARTNTPLQALTLLNDPQFVEAAVALARRMVREEGASDEATLERGWRLCLARAPEPEESARLLALQRSQLAHYRADLAASEALVANGPADALPDDDPARIAAWTIVANVLLNLDETLSLE